MTLPSAGGDWAPAIQKPSAQRPTTAQTGLLTIVLKMQGRGPCSPSLLRELLMLPSLFSLLWPEELVLVREFNIISEELELVQGEGSKG